MNRKSFFWIVDYIKKHRENATRYAIDLDLLRQGYDAEMIEEAWKTVSANKKLKDPAVLANNFLKIFVCNVLSWWSALFISWQSEASKIANPTNYKSPVGDFAAVASHWGIHPGFLFLPLILWTLILVTTVWNKTYKTKYLKDPMILGLFLTAFMFGYTLLTVAMAFSHLDWEGPSLLLTFLAVSLILTIRNLKNLSEFSRTLLYADVFQ